jgi:hypothetical protein
LTKIISRLKPSGEPTFHVNSSLKLRVAARAIVAKDRHNINDENMLKEDKITRGRETEEARTRRKQNREKNMRAKRGLWGLVYVLALAG